MFATLAKHISPFARRFSPLLEFLKPRSGTVQKKEDTSWQALSEEPVTQEPAKDPAAELLAALNGYDVQFERLVAKGAIIVRLKDDIRTIDFSGKDEELAKAVNDARLVQAFLRQAGIDAAAGPEEAAQALTGVPLDFYIQTLQGSVEVMRRQ